MPTENEAFDLVAIVDYDIANGYLYEEYDPEGLIDLAMQIIEKVNDIQHRHSSGSKL